MKLQPNVQTNSKYEHMRGSVAWDFFRRTFSLDVKFLVDSITENNANAYVFMGDMTSNLFYITDNMRDDFAFSGNLVENLLERWVDRIHGEIWKERFTRDIFEMLHEKREVHDLRYEVEDACGNVFWIRCCGQMKWENNGPVFFSGRITKQDESFVVDSVTNFLSANTLQIHLKERQESGQHTTALGFWLNHIDEINQARGRIAGNQLLTNIARRLMDLLAGKMRLYRIKGIRSVALIDEIQQEEVEMIIHHIKEIVANEFRAIDDVIEPSCYFAVMHISDKAQNIDEFEENMIALLRIARKTPQMKYVVDTAENVRRADAIQEAEHAATRDVLADMRNFRAVVQPIVSSKTEEIVAGEVLMRWKYLGQEVSPERFIPFLEKCHLIHIAGRWVFEQAVRVCSEIIKSHPDFYLTVNMSLKQLNDETFLSFVPMILEKYHLSGEHIVIEMTESCMDQEPAKLNRLIETFQKSNIRFSLDDFGTGYSSLRVLMQYPTDIVKLDRSLLLEMMQSSEKFEFINSIVFSCHRFGKKVCMEGVETELQRQIAKNADSDLIQGYYYYKPLELETLLDILKQSH